MQKRKFKKLAISLTIVSVVVLISGYYIITGWKPKQVSYSTIGTTTEYGVFGVTMFSKHDYVKNPNVAIEVQDLLEQAGIVLFLDQSNPMKEWRAYRIDYFESERLGLEIETNATETEIIDHYRSVLGAESSTNTTSGSYYSWHYAMLNDIITVSIHPSHSTAGANRVKIDFLRKLPLKTVEELKPNQQTVTGQQPKP